MKKTLFLVILCPLILLLSCVSAEQVNPTSIHSSKDSISSISVSDKCVAVGSEDNSLYFFDTNLDLRWRYESTDWVTSTALSDEFVVIGSLDNKITVLTHNEEVEWERYLETYVEYPHALDASGDTIAVGTRDGYLHIFDKGGELRSRQKTCAYLIFVKILEDSIIAVSDRQIHVFDLDGGKIKSTPLNSHIRSAYVSETHIAAGLGNNELTLFDKDGTLMWSRNLPDQIGSVYVSKNYVVAGLRDWSIHLFNINGEAKWRKQLSDSVISVSTEGNHVLAATLDERLHLFNLNGVTRWEYLTKGRVKDMQITRLGVFAGTSFGETYYFRVSNDTPSMIFVISVTIIVLVVAFAMFLNTFK